MFSDLSFVGSAANAEFAFSGNYRSNRIEGRNSYGLENDTQSAERQSSRAGGSAESRRVIQLTFVTKRLQVKTLLFETSDCRAQGVTLLKYPA
jgi:hypothetical protein